MEVLSLRALLRLPSRLLTATLGVTVAVTVILLLSSLSEGVYTAAIRYPQQNLTDLYVGQQGVTRLQSTSFLPPHLQTTIARVKGVHEVAPLTMNLVVLDINGGKSPVYIYGYDREHGFGGPWKLSEGRPVQQSGEAVLDASLASQYGLTVGSKLDILGQSFGVVGLSADSRSLLGASIFLDISDARRTLGLPPAVNFYLVRLDRAAEANQVALELAQALSTPAGVSILTRDQVISETRSVVKQIMGGPLAMASAVAYLVGIALIAILRYNSVMGRLGEFAAMRAIGATTWDIVRYDLLMESFITLAAGALLGIGVTLVVGSLLTVWIPHLEVALNQSLLVRAFISTFTVGLLGAIWPVRRLSQVEPVSVFRAQEG